MLDLGKEVRMIHIEMYEKEGDDDETKTNSM